MTEPVKSISTSIVRKPQQNVQKQEEQIRVFEFENLPKIFQTAEMRAKLDKDGSGWIESKNSKGEDETYALSWLLDKMVGKSDIVKVEKNKSIRDCDERFDGYDKNGKHIRSHIYEPGFQHYEYTYNNDEITKEKEWMEGYPEKTDVKETIVEQGKNYKKTIVKKWNLATPEKVNTNTKTEFTNGFGNSVIYKDGTKRRASSFVQKSFFAVSQDSIFNEKGQLIESSKTEYIPTTQGLQRIMTAKKYTPKNNGKIDIYVAHGVNELGEYKFGETVDIKEKSREKIGKGRTKITYTDGKEVYYSHDGKKLKPEYVRSNP